MRTIRWKTKRPRLIRMISQRRRLLSLKQLLKPLRKYQLMPSQRPRTLLQRRLRLRKMSMRKSVKTMLLRTKLNQLRLKLRQSQLKRRLLVLSQLLHRRQSLQ